MALIGEETMEQLRDLIKAVNDKDAERKEDQLLQYMELVLERNQHVNLTAITDRDEFIRKHYIDSLAAAALPEFQAAETVIDLGTGGGFPGVPLAIVFPEKQFTLVDSLNKRIRIIQEFCETLGIRNVTAIHGRAEDLGQQEDLRESFEACVSRAVADMRVLAEYCLPFVKVGGAFIAYKSSDCGEELQGAKRAIGLLGGGACRLDSAESEEHLLVAIPKYKPTPKQYPRRAGTPGKKPL